MKRDITPLTPRGETEIEMKRPMVSGVLYERGRASCQPQWRRGGAPEGLCSHSNVDVVPAKISMRRDRTWHKPHTVFS